ncbi:transcription factor SPT20 homolog [Drosophila busckii]|uniref:transcription factor SPT20 homolog n=1 Tax=Drosophila busckii TaxID=30019 RepID=UPI00083F018D|nr:transcription factor SPT20 homolog [Drosophila busckii]
MAESESEAPSKDNLKDATQDNVNERESCVTEREDRPLVLEERHSLSIAETKKRRASVYSNENLFIPKELARGELHQRKNTPAVNTLDQINNTDYSIRMLKFPVGTGRARIVAREMKHRRLSDARPTSDQRIETRATKSEPRIKQEFRDAEATQLSMPILETDSAMRLNSDDECSIVLQEIVEGNWLQQGATSNLPKRLLKRATSDPELSHRRDKTLKQLRRHRQQLHWHSPNSLGSELKIDSMCVNNNADIQVCHNQQEITPTTTVDDQVVAATVQEITAVEEHQQQEVPAMTVELLIGAEDLTVERIEIKQQQHKQPEQPTVAHVPYRLPNSNSTATTQSTSVTLSDSTLPNASLYPQRYTLPQQQQHFMRESSVLPPWNKPHFENHAYAQHQQSPQSQQLLAPATYYQQPHLHIASKELKQLSDQYERVKNQEKEQQKSFNRTLKKLYTDRLLFERQHADYHRAFMNKMVENKKQEDLLQSQKEQLSRQLGQELAVLEQRMTEMRRQLDAGARSWYWQQQQHQYQQLQLQLQQQYYLRQPPAPPPPNSPQVPKPNCMQCCSACADCAEPQNMQRVLMPPPTAPATSPLTGLALQATTARDCYSPGRIMRRRHTIDHRSSHMTLYPRRPSTSLPLFPPPPQTTSVIAHTGNAQLNQPIEQTAITSIIRNFVANYLPDTDQQ